VTPIPGSLHDVSLGQARWDEALDRLPTEFLWRPAEHFLHSRAGVHDPSATVDGKDGIRVRVEHLLGAEPEWCGSLGSRRPWGFHLVA
jgi:hypothetical protein